MGINKLKVDKKIMHKTFSFNSEQLSEKTFDPAMPLTISGVANMANQDRSGDVVLASAWMLDNYKSNPVILFNHCYDNLVGRATSVEVTDKGLEITCEIGNPSAGYELTDMQENVRSLLAQGILKAFSVGFIPLEGDYDEKNESFIITKAELLEVSLVTVPCQQESLISEIKILKNQEGEKQMDEEMKTVLSALMEEVKGCREKINAIYDKIAGGKPEDKPEDKPSPMEESLKNENTELKAQIQQYDAIIQELKNLI